MATLLLLAVQSVPSDEDAERALKELRKALQESGDDVKIAAIKTALKVDHETVIKAVGELLTSGTDPVRSAGALALGEVDHPASVAALTAAIQANRKKPSNLGAIARALGQLGWESAAAPLHDLMEDSGDRDIRECLGDIVRAVGQIGSATSVKPLQDLNMRLKDSDEAGRKAALRVNPALEQIAIRKEDKREGRTGFSAKWWKENQERLLALAKRTYWSKKTHQRTVVEPGAKAPPDSVLVGVRITDRPEK